MRSFAVVGPSQSGKTTLIQGMASLERERTDSLFLNGDTSITQFSFMGEQWAALEAPGGHDAFSQVGAILTICDAAILCVPAQTESSVLAAPYLRCLDEAEIPTFLFINKIDVATERVAEIVASLQDFCSAGIVLRQVPIRNGEEVTGFIDLISERAWEYNQGHRSSLVELPSTMRDREQEARSDLIEALADYDDELLEQIIEDKAPATKDVYSISTQVLQHHDLVPALLGCAAHGSGLLRMLKSLRHEVPDVSVLRERLDLNDTVRAASCLADQRKHLGKVNLVRALDADLDPRCRLGGNPIGALTKLDGKTPVQRTLEAGEFFLAIKSDHVVPRTFFDDVETYPFPRWSTTYASALKRSIHPVHEKDEGKLSTALLRLAEIDPGLAVAPDESSGAPVISVMGQQHLNAVISKLADAFGIQVMCEYVPPLLRETIRGKTTVHFRHRKQSGGAGQFADVVIEVAPRATGSGTVFSESVKGGAVPRNYIPAVENGAREALLAGPRGHKVVDIAIELKDGKSHAVDSSDFAFRTAGQNAIKEALKTAGTRILQPIMSLRVHVPSRFSGSLVQVFNGLKGQVVGFDAHPTAKGWDVFRAMLPMAKEEELSRTLGSATRGTAWFVSEFDHYEELRTPVSAGEGL